MLFGKRIALEAAARTPQGINRAAATGRKPYKVVYVPRNALPEVKGEGPDPYVRPAAEALP